VSAGPVGSISGGQVPAHTPVRVTARRVVRSEHDSVYPFPVTSTV
jgi:hypothetical protein